MTRKFLLDLGLDTDVIGSIMKENGNDIEREKERYTTLKSEYQTLKDENGTLTSANAELKKQVESSSKLNVKETDEYKALLKEHEDYKAKNESEKAQTEKTKALESALKKAGASASVINLLVSAYGSLEVPKKDDGSLDYSSIVEKAKAENSGLFGEAKLVGGNVSEPPKGNPTVNNPFKKGEHFSLEEQTKLFKEDPQKARELAKQAGIKL